MELTKKQYEGLQIALERYRAGKKFTVISGYAGTGKSTLVKFIINALGLPEGSVGYATFTGKASLVLRQKGNENACTMHKLLYEFRPLGNGRFFRTKREKIPYDIVVIDEVSMVPKDMMNDLFSYDVYVLCLGDPFQLPPINPTTDNKLLEHPHVFLDEIMRQALDSEIIRVSMDIRNGRDLQRFDGKEVKIYNKNELSAGMLNWADQILVATNKTRMNINNKVRELQKRGRYPEIGDKITCSCNYWNVLSSTETPLINGAIGTIDRIHEDSFYIPKHIITSEDIIAYDLDFNTENDGLFSNIVADKGMLLTEKPDLSDKQQEQLKRTKKTDLEVYNFIYAYAITCHRAQGSQWNNVLVIEERFPFAKEEHARWLYTAVTRAVDKCVIIRK